MSQAETKNYDIIIIGAGIIGLTIARTLVQRGFKRIAIFEKEAQLGVHSSGRNSGVLHAGIYYAADSIKAKVCSRGSKMMQDYAAEHGILCKKLGKVIVAQKPELASQIDVLIERSRANGIRVEKIDEQQLKSLEPEAISHGPALFSPDTAVIDSKAVLQSLKTELLANGVDVIQGEEVMSIDIRQKLIRASGRAYGFGHFFNAAGLHADKVAHWVGVGKKYRILPFKGIYRKMNPATAVKFRSSIYPVPDLDVPFLGVHITRSVHDDVMIGPTAIPAFGRENYAGLEGLNIEELPMMAWDLLTMMKRNQGGFRRMVFEELNKYRETGYLQAVQALAPSIRAEDILESGKVGLRAQLIDEEKMKLEMDFILERGPHSTHVLNAISPAFTSSLALAEMIVDRSELSNSGPELEPSPGSR